MEVNVLENSKNELKVELETNQQTICVIDNAGGLKQSELSFVVSPGQTANAPTEEIIGIFGVADAIVESVL